VLWVGAVRRKSTLGVALEGARARRQRALSGRSEALTFTGEKNERKSLPFVQKYPAIVLSFYKEKCAGKSSPFPPRFSKTKSPAFVKRKTGPKFSLDKTKASFINKSNGKLLAVSPIYPSVKYHLLPGEIEKIIGQLLRPFFTQ
jgi:hypothetical protein